MAKLPALKLNGSPLDLDRNPPAVTTLKKYLDRLPADELLTTYELAKAAKMSGDTIKRLISRFPEYTALHRSGSCRQRIYGSPRAIEAYRGLIESQ